MGTTPADPREIRAADDDRDRVAEVLNEALARGRLSPDEHSERLNAVYAAKTLGELELVVRDLPAPRAGLPAEATHPHRRVRAVLSKIRRRGHWAVPRDSEARAVFGAVVLDLRDAVFPEPEVTITASSFCGKIEMRVPDNAVVYDSGTALFGKRTLPSGAPSGGGGPVIHIKGRSTFGHIRVSRGDRRWWR